jgi:uncharacterized protein DUF6623
MALYSNWTHGNSLTVESPDNLDSMRYRGWGPDVFVTAGQNSWFHIPIPTPRVVNDITARLLRVYLLFRCEEGEGEIRNVHIYDGSFVVQEFNDLHLAGHHRTQPDGENTFPLDAPHVVERGIGVTFFFQAAIGFEATIQPYLTVAAAGGDFDVTPHERPIDRKVR